MDVLRRLAEMMSRVPGRRKAVLFFSQGLDYDVYDVMGKDTSYASEVRDALAEAIAAATRANVAFYPIDPRGLAVAGFGKDDTDQPETFAGESSRARRRHRRVCRRKQQRLQAGARRVVEENSTILRPGLSSQ